MKTKGRQPKAGMLAVPEYVRARKLYETIMDATEQLAQLARAELPNQEQTVTAAGATWRTAKQYATSFLGGLPGVATRKVLEVLADAPDAPCKLSHVLTVALTDAVKQFGNAVDKRPEQFCKWKVRQLGQLPTLSPMVADEDLRADAGIKRTGAINLARVANKTIAALLLQAPQLLAWSKGTPPEFFCPSWLRELAAKPLPPLSKATATDYFDRLIRPQLEHQRAELLKGVLRAYRDTLRSKGKTDAITWHRFLWDCRKALKRLAPLNS